MLMAVVQHRQSQFHTLFDKVNNVLEAQMFTQDEPSSNVCPVLEETPMINASGRLLEVEPRLTHASKKRKKKKIKVTAGSMHWDEAKSGQNKTRK